MQDTDVLETLPADTWAGPFTPELGARAVAALEAGKVLFFPHLAFTLSPEERGFLSPSAVDGSRKNISFDPATGTCHGTALTGADAARLAAMLDRFGTACATLLAGLAPAYVPGLERARTSFRPVEITGRPTSPRHDDRRLHLDAFPTRPMHGRRILRVFSNVAEDVSRDWLVGEAFADHAGKLLPQARPAPAALSWAQALLGVTKGRRSAYDRLMLALHDAAKLDDAYQSGAPRAAVSFPPGTTWMVFTDQVPHAAIAGRHALETTFHLPVDRMASPDRAPVRVLERMTGRALV